MEDGNGQDFKNKVAEALRAIIEGREPQAVYDADTFRKQILRPSDLAERVVQSYHTKHRGGVSPGWKSLEPYYRPRAGELTVVHGIPGHGKSSFVNNLAVNLIKQHQWKFAIYSAEMQPPEEHLRLFITQASGWPIDDGPSPRLSIQDIRAVAQTLEPYVSFVKFDLDSNPTIDDLIQHAHWQHKVEGLNGLIIDPWNELDHSRPAWQSETEYCSVALSKLKRLVQTDKIHCWLIAHPVKIMPDKEGRRRKPTMYDINGSAAFFNKADMGMMIWRDTEDNEGLTEIQIQKVRWKVNGMIGSVELRFNRATGQYFDL